MTAPTRKNSHPQFPGSHPTKNPSLLYPKVPGIHNSAFSLPPQGLTQVEREVALNELHQHQSRQKSHMIGFQTNLSASYQEDLGQYLNYHINNIGDPFQEGNYTLNSKWMERAVLDYFASLWNARWPHNPHDPESYWGYVLTMGSSEGNMYGLWNARDYLSGKFLMADSEDASEAKRLSMEGSPRPARRHLMYQQARIPEQDSATSGRNAYSPVAFFSEDTHYSVIKAVRMLGITTFYELGNENYPNENPLAPGQPWPKEVPSTDGENGPGSIDIPSLVKLVKFFAARGYPILVSLNFGTTFKGAYDDIEAVGRQLMPVFKEFGLDKRRVFYDPKDPSRYDERTGYWVHVDGALGAAYAPFIEMAHNARRIAQRLPNFDFRLPFVHSITMSGHKWIGAPWPCGVYMTKTGMQLRPPDDPEYIGSPDTTFGGSRNGFSAMVLWDYLAKTSHEEQMEQALANQALAAYACEKLTTLQKHLRRDLWVNRTPFALAVRFKRPNAKIVFKYSLAGETLYVNGRKREYAHLFAMPHVTAELIDQFVEDLSQPGAFPPQRQGTAERPTAGTAVGAGKKLSYIPHHGRGFS